MFLALAFFMLMYLYMCFKVNSFCLGLFGQVLCWIETLPFIEEDFSRKRSVLINLLTYGENLSCPKVFLFCFNIILDSKQICPKKKKLKN